MELGVIGLNANETTHSAADTVELASLAEELGYTSWWAIDHVVLPNPQTPDSPKPASEPILDPLVHLSYVAAVTRRIELGTGIVILPQRNPVVLAKQAASLDALSGGRLLLGVGAGYLAPELAAVGVSLAERGARTDEYLDAITALWTHPEPAFHGRFVSFDHVDAYPKPANPHLIVGGASPGAFRRAVSRGHGWLGTGSIADLERNLAGLRKAATEVDRPAWLGELQINQLSVSDTDHTADDVRRYADLGVRRLVLFPHNAADLADVRGFLRRHAELPH